MASVTDPISSVIVTFDRTHTRTDRLPSVPASLARKPRVQDTGPDHDAANDEERRRVPARRGRAEHRRAVVRPRAGHGLLAGHRRSIAGSARSRSSPSSASSSVSRPAILNVYRIVSQAYPTTSAGGHRRAGPAPPQDPTPRDRPRPLRRQRPLIRPRACSRRDRPNPTPRSGASSATRRSSAWRLAGLALLADARPAGGRAGRPGGRRADGRQLPGHQGRRGRGAGQRGGRDPGRRLGRLPVHRPLRRHRGAGLGRPGAAARPPARGVRGRHRPGAGIGIEALRLVRRGQDQDGRPGASRCTVRPVLYWRPGIRYA